MALHATTAVYPDLTKRQERSAFIFGVILVYLVGMLARASAFPNPLVGVAFSLLVDSFVLVLVLANRQLAQWVERRIHGAALTAYLLANASVSAGIVILFTILLGQAIPALATPWQAHHGAQFVYFAYLFIAWSVAGRWLAARQAASNDQLRAVTAENAMIVAEMQQLRMQLDPHFLFNALNMIAVDIHDRPRRATQLLRELSQYLRYSLDTADLAFVPVALEVAGMRAFLRVQQMRFGSTLKSRIVVEGSMRGRRIPTFLMQPLIENATKHGVPGPDGVLSVTIAVTAERDALAIVVRNDGDLTSRQTALPGTSTGLPNVTKRLRLHYPGRHAMTLEQLGDQVVTTLRLQGEPC
ncbi:MAG: histidine kinase [Acetobacteraceae bacterium]|nr:histidine kinase [Acetobacteraceae bacterium]